MTVLVAVDGSPPSDDAVRATAALPLADTTRVVVLTVVEDVLRATAGLGADELAAVEAAAAAAEQEAEAVLDAATRVLKERGLTVEGQRRRGNAAEEILDLADERNVDLIVVGSHGWGGIRRFLLGSVSDQVFRSARQSVCIVRGSTVADHRSDDGWRLLVAYDGSSAADRAVDLCARLTLDETDTIELLTVIPVVNAYRQDLSLQFAPLLREQRATAETEIAGAAERLSASAATVITRVVDADDVSDAILDASNDVGADLVVLGHRGRGLIERFVTGSVASRIAPHAEQTVLSIR